MKLAESRIQSITSADSDIFAVRKSLYSGISDHSLNYDDAIIIELLKKGHRVIYEPQANAFKNTPRDIKQDYIKTSNQSEAWYRLIFSEWSSIFPPKNLYRFMFFSHRTLHLLVPFLLITLIACSFPLYHIEIIRNILFLQLAIYSFSIINWSLRNTSIFKSYTSIIMYFVIMNIALLFGFLKYLFTGFKGLFRRKKQLKAST